MGPFRIIATQRKSGKRSLEIACPYHGCFKGLQYNEHDVESYTVAMKKLKLWAAEGLAFPPLGGESSKAQHLSIRPVDMGVLDDVTLQGLKPDSDDETLRDHMPNFGRHQKRRKAEVQEAALLGLSSTVASSATLAVPAFAAPPPAAAASSVPAPPVPDTDSDHGSASSSSSSSSSSSGSSS